MIHVILQHVTVSDAVTQHQMTPAAQKLFASLPPEYQNHLESMNNVSAAIATDRTIRMWKIAAEKVLASKKTILIVVLTLYQVC